MDPVEWYRRVPVVSRLYLTCSVLTTAACALELVSPFTLYFNYRLIVEKGQFWRLLTNFLFFGQFGPDFFFHMYFLFRHCTLLEEGPQFRRRPGDFLFMLLFGAVLMLAVAPFLSIQFYGSALASMLVYVWARRNEHAQMVFLGMLAFRAPFLPWVLVGFSLLLGQSASLDIMGIVVGHLYFYLKDVLGQVSEFRGWHRRDFLPTPRLIKMLMRDEDAYGDPTAHLVDAPPLHRPVENVPLVAAG